MYNRVGYELEANLKFPLYRKSAEVLSCPKNF